ncbi:PREDICTED: beta-microseminoprotein [Nanorana parkeri]|uniref:beta-microseminoprotein n=1 Tax=Nanorana parkeri TaxID=125878 RepID=UPI0008542A51|nr:PREDICTED: beta-microseminoprotein [Nanorana parkeri]
MGCTHKGETHKRGTQWKTENCEDCWCQKDGTMRCCTAYGTPFGYDKENCERVFDKASCSYKLIPIKDPTVECKETGMVG